MSAAARVARRPPCDLYHSALQVEVADERFVTVGKVPTPVWGRDQLGAGEMWNSNSVIAWVIARSGLDSESVQPPVGGRAPGWHAGVAVARGQAKVTAQPGR